MNCMLKPVGEQTIVITGATSGIGLVTARKAARRGAKLVLFARNEGALNTLCEEIRQHGGLAVPVAGDVANLEDLQRAAAKAVDTYGGFDTWVNNAGVSIFGTAAVVPLEDQRRLFETNYWGVVHGSLVAADHFRRKRDFHGGAIVNMGSEASDAPVPLQSAYVASKHAVKGFTDSLRLEMESDHLPVSVTLIKPAAIDTMFVMHAKNYMNVEPRLPPPIYDPDLVADAILFAAAHPRRTLFVGGAAKFTSASAYHAPRLFDRVAATLFSRGQRTVRPARPRDDNALHDSRHALHEREGMDGPVLRSCAYNTVVQRPKMAGAVALGAAALVFAALARARRGSA
ncbi:TPA: SDR family oxidoreductase [Burkholderia cepacia]|uniref:SDR family oxidoreductase n=1 Tax=Burkholderia cepacia TaxID=292 RepID=UPI001CF28146|nr:SDR family oxidoreductase [Burkholderia cepacia]MCA8356670.1 SDR family oxidoreductase [Burkholderia cepacia]HDR9759920.1 SDR family oxidoreductase [Burkholderia cepacia ATCC 25416]HDV6364462.1 SDR family oxidoreductase [Burkholderia cepacia]